MTSDSNFTSVVATSFTGDLTGDVTGNIAPSAETAAYGAGALGTSTFGGPQLTHYQLNDTIITEIKVDITGLACKGDAADDAIGLAAGDPAYIGRYVTATYGIVYRVEMACIEAPGEGTATITQDIDLATEATGLIEYDGAIGGATLINTATLVAGEVVINNAPAMTANDYIYLAEGDAAATTGVYNAGQFIIRFYGHALLA